MIDTSIIDKATGKAAKVSDQGELIMRTAEYSTAIKRQITDANAVNFFKPRSGKKFIVTGLIINTDRNVAGGGAIIAIYEASTPTSTTILSDIVEIDQLRSTTNSLLP